MLRNKTATCENDEVGHLHHRQNSKFINELNVRAKTIKLQEEIIGKKLHNTGFVSDFLDMTP